MSYAQPDAGGDKIPFKDQGHLLDGSLLLINVLEVLPPVPNQYSRPDKPDPEPVKAVVAVLDGPLKGEVYWDTLIFPAKLSASLKSKIGEVVLGRLGRGQARQGQSAPWVLNPFSPNDPPVADAFRQANPDFDKAKPPVKQQNASYQPSGNTEAAWGGAAQEADPWGTEPAPPAGPSAGVQFLINAGVPAHLATDFDAAGVKVHHVQAVKHISGWENVPPARIIAKAHELEAKKASEPPF